MSTAVFFFFFFFHLLYTHRCTSVQRLSIHVCYFTFFTFFAFSLQELLHARNSEVEKVTTTTKIPKFKRQSKCVDRLSENVEIFGVLKDKCVIVNYYFFSLLQLLYEHKKDCRCNERTFFICLIVLFFVFIFFFLALKLLKMNDFGDIDGIDLKNKKVEFFFWKRTFFRWHSTATMKMNQIFG